LQEVKASPDQLPAEISAPLKYHAHYATAEKKGYSGVALFSKKQLAKPQITIGLGIEKFDREGRTIIAEYPRFILFNGYFPNGGRDHKRVPYKLEYSQKIAEKALLLSGKTKKPVILTGDFNTAHQEIDLANPKTNQNTTGFLPKERAWMDRFIKQGFFDVFRLNHPGKNGHYTWWTYRGDCRERNVGWRLDYFFVTEKLLPLVEKIHHCPEVAGSDHCPVVLRLTI
ncbi:MAG: exodeoxyribonuclease III, partial [Halobacteriovoraceae bacterium]|nr:exodeoxyribonuclease III [Halobacteriovoraceae bacterium]